MAIGTKFLPTEINLNKAEPFMSPGEARFIKNLVYDITDTSDADGKNNGETGVYKPLQSVIPYFDGFPQLPGYSQTVGEYSNKDIRAVFVFRYNSEGQHTIYRINGESQTYDTVMRDVLLNFQLDPQYFIHTGGCWVEWTLISDPITGEQKSRTFLMYTDGKNSTRQICVEDSIATHGFDASLFPYFQGNYNRQLLINFGVPTPSDCIGIEEIALPDNEKGLSNEVLFNTFQWRLRYYDVWGRPSEYGIISDEWYLDANCIQSSSGLNRCVNLSFDAPPPHINQVEVAFRNCNSQQWYKAETLDIYTGSNFGDWWLRSRNPKIQYDPTSNKITYKFCNDKGCDPIAPTNTNRLYNPIPRTSQAVSKVDKYVLLSNNKHGFLPFSQELKDKIKVSVIAPTTQGNSSTFATAEILVEIYNPFNNGSQPIFRQGISADEPVAYGFGNFGSSVQYRAFFAYKQYFKNTSQKGFIGYLGNTFVTSKQFVLNIQSGTFTEVTDFSTVSNDNSKYRYFQKFDFNNIPKGKYIFRIASHQSDPSVDINWRKTSTYTAGQFGFNFSNRNQLVNHGQLINPAPELIVDVCNGNYDSRNDNKILVIWDLNEKNCDIQQGYVYNTDDTTQAQYGVELMRFDGGGLPFQPRTTDHNGFYFGADLRGSGTTNYQIYGYCGCILKDLIPNINTGTGNELHIDDFYLNRQSGIFSVCKDYATQKCNYIVIKGKVLLCNSTVGVPNVSVTLSRGHSSLTDSDGNFTIVAFDDTIHSSRVDDLYFNSNSCNFTDCNGECIGITHVDIQKCVTCDVRELNVSTIFVKFVSLRGLLSGTTYPIGTTGWDLGDRPTFIQSLGNISTPSVQDTKIFAPAQVKIDIDPMAIFPAETEYLTFSVGTPADISQYIEWIVDDVTFIDNTGKENKDAPTQIKLGYASLIEYNKQNNYNTTVNWDFLAPNPDSLSVKPTFVTDKVQFIINGDGTFFNKQITQLVKYDQSGQYFLIDYTSELKGLLPFAKIRIIRPKQCTITEPLYEVCYKLIIKDRKATVNSFILNTFDTYYIYRQIPVPVKVGDETQNQLHVFGVPFEHDSPSDLWGKGCKNIGRPNVINPQETVIYSIDQHMLSGAISETGQLNFLNFFEDSDTKVITPQSVNGVVAVLFETAIGLVIGQSDHYIIGFSDNIARVNSSGQVIAPSIQNQFGQPQSKIGNNFGCLLEDKNTISKYEGIVFFVDGLRGDVVRHNYAKATSVSEKSCDGYFRAKVKSIQEYNRTNDNKRYMHGCINSINNEYLLADYTIKSNVFLNSLRDFDPFVNETISFNTFNEAFRGTYEFVPEYFARLDSERLDNQLFSFTNGNPNMHYTVLGNKGYGIVYGQKVNRVIKTIIAGEILKKKKPLSIGIYCKEGTYFSPTLRTETGQSSRILLSQWLEANFGWYAPFLCDLSTPADPNRPNQSGKFSIFEGNTLIGNWAEITLVGDPSLDDKYTQLEGFIINTSGEPQKDK